MRLTASAVLTSASTEGEAAKESELIGEAAESLQVAATAAGAFNILLVFRIIRVRFSECDFAVIASVLLC